MPGVSVRSWLSGWLMFLLVTPLCLAGKSAEEKQKEIEAALVKSAAAPTADLTKIQCGNFVYATNRSSVCFADAFLGRVAKETNLNVGREFVPVKLGSDTVFNFPFCVWSGQESFTLTQQERENLRRYLANGGFILSSPGCSDKNWDASLRRELKLVFPDKPLKQIPMSHAIFSTVAAIPALTDKHGKSALVEGLELDGRLVMVYSKEGLNDVSNAKGCCCCGGNEIMQAASVNLNVLVYALLY